VPSPSTTPAIRSRELLYPLGYPVAVETDDSRVQSLIEKWWGGWPQLVPGEPLKVAIRRGKVEQVAPKMKFQSSTEGFRLDGAASASFDAASLSLHIQTGHPLSEHFLHTALLAALDFSIFTPLHAACVVKSGVGLVLCGDSGAGKSTLAYACARQGWTLVSDDSLHALPGHGTTVASFSSTIHLREPVRALFPELRSEQMGVAPNGKQAITILPTQRGFQTARTASVDRVIFLSRRAGPTRLTPFSLEAAAQYFFKYLWQPDLAGHQRRLREMVNSTGALLLEFEHIEQAVAALEHLLKEEGVAA
jgi:hypothetical protein